MNTSGSSSDRNPVEALADDFLRRQRGGERPTLEEYCRRHPELADEIREVFPVLIRMEDLALRRPRRLHRRRGRSRRDAAGAAGRLPHPPRGRPRRHGRRLRGRAGVARPARGAEGPARCGAVRRQAGAALPARGAGRGAAAPHQHRAGLRRGPGRRASLLRHAVHPRHGARRRPGGAAAIATGRGEPARRRAAPVSTGRSARRRWPRRSSPAGSR